MLPTEFFVLHEKALVTFKMLQDGGSSGDLDIKPNTNTYDAIVRACASGNIEDAPAIYEAMKLSGIPELYCYTAAHRKLR